MTETSQKLRMSFFFLIILIQTEQTIVLIQKTPVLTGILTMPQKFHQKTIREADPTTQPGIETIRERINCILYLPVYERL